jgi:hypothetical protein
VIRSEPAFDSPGQFLVSITPDLAWPPQGEEAPEGWGVLGNRRGEYVPHPRHWEALREVIK